MKPAADFYAAFERAGFLCPATWTARIGGASAQAGVRYKAPTVEVLGGEGVITLDASARWPYGTFADARAGDRLQVVTQHGTADHRIAELHRVGSGEQVRADLAAWT